EGDVIYLAIGLRNVGSGMALLHAWYVIPDRVVTYEDHADPELFRRLSIDLFVPAGGAGYWESAVREVEGELRSPLLDVVAERRPFTVEILYGDQHGGQRMISRFVVLPASDGGWYSHAGRHGHPPPPPPRPPPTASPPPAP